MLAYKLIPIIRKAADDIGMDDDKTEDLYLDFPTDSHFGDLATNLALRVSSVLKKPPIAIAEDLSYRIKKHLKDSPLNQYVADVKAEGAGFVNFYLTDTYFYEQLQAILAQGREYVRGDVGKGKSVLIEFVSANPTGPLSVAHARQAAVGDALANILEFLNFRVQREYYLNDEGNQIALLGRSIALRLKELHGETVDFPKDHYQGEYIYDIASQIKKSVSAVQDFSQYGVSSILSIIKQELQDFGVRFDSWYSQKALRESGKISQTLDVLKEKGFLYEEDRALWFKSSAFGDDKDRVVIKSDGSYTYLAPDIAYHQDKYQRGFQWLINLWGPDHHGYIQRLKASVAALGKPSESLSIIIVQLATIFRDGHPVQMSTRRGEFITLREILDEVGADAARFFFLMRRTSSHLDFDLALAKKQTPENPVYYIQYAHARICSILRSKPPTTGRQPLDMTRLKEKEELVLIKKLCELYPVLNICVHTLDPYMVTVYLQEVAETFHKFYDQHRVLGQNDALTQARLGLIQATKSILATGLELLGVSRPEKM